MRRARWIVAVAVTLALAPACTVGSSTYSGVDPTPDAVPDGAGDAPGDGAQADCINPVAPIDGHHNAGQNCQVGGCHLAGNTGNGAPAFYVSGTLYNNVNGTTPVSGATIVVVAGAATHNLATGTDGNFYLETQVTPPFTVKASKCPDEEAMIAQATSGACNSCHAVGQDGRIHLP